jgi:hypothetical protein
MPKRQLTSQRAARDYVLDSLIATLENDLDGTGANYLYENLSEADSKMAVTAARKLVTELQKLKTLTKDTQMNIPDPETTATIARKFKEFHEFVVTPNAEWLAEHMLKGELPALVRNPHPIAHRLLKELGWDGVADHFVISRQRAKRLARTLKNIDAPAAQWLTSNRPCRVYVFIDRANLCMNFNTQTEELTMEPGTSDEARAN